MDSLEVHDEASLEDGSVVEVDPQLLVFPDLQVLQEHQGTQVAVLQVLLLAGSEVEFQLGECR